jgi:hypothetical protein
MKVYVLIVESTLSYETNREIKVFKNQKDAEEAFNKEVEAAIMDAGEDWEIEKDNMSFSIYEDGYYLINNITISVSEKEVK